MTIRLGIDVIKEHSILRQPNEEWLELCQHAAEWIWEEHITENFGKYLNLLYVEPSFSEDTKVRRYYGLSKTNMFKEYKRLGCNLIYENLIEKNGEILFYGLLSPSKLALPDIIKWIKDQRHCFLVFSESELFTNNALNKIIELKKKNSNVNIDQVEIVEELISFNLHPIRLWGQFDDTEFSVEVY
ncbi:MAG: hypothetical protein HWE30_19220 [Methylocystaceae bacterium]|nr:hypothetical protein [Methylocystaceae bacterium]